MPGPEGGSPRADPERAAKPRRMKALIPLCGQPEVSGSSCGCSYGCSWCELVGATTVVVVVVEVAVAVGVLVVVGVVVVAVMVVVAVVAARGQR